jgi:hypothetical protein
VYNIISIDTREDCACPYWSEQIFLPSLKVMKTATHELRLSPL